MEREGADMRSEGMRTCASVDGLFSECGQVVCLVCGDRENLWSWDVLHTIHFRPILQQSLHGSVRSIKDTTVSLFKYGTTMSSSS